MVAYSRDEDPIVGVAAFSKRKKRRLEEQALWSHRFILSMNDYSPAEPPVGAASLDDLWAGLTGLVDYPDPDPRMTDPRMTDARLAEREALVDADVAARALHSPGAMNLRGRSYTREPTAARRSVARQNSGIERVQKPQLPLSGNNRVVNGLTLR